MTDAAQSLTAREAIAIAANHGLPYAQFKDVIRENLEQARAYHLTPRRDGLRKSAIDYFRGYMADVACEVGAEEAASMAEGR